VFLAISAERLNGCGGEFNVRVVQYSIANILSLKTASFQKYLFTV
tara:strand:- start:764 stop:898 length:135 start_codon:yes stop_codon:yes gene_type:complete